MGGGSGWGGQVGCERRIFFGGVGGVKLGVGWVGWVGGLGWM